MITHLRICNFLSFKDLCVSPRIRTVLVGPNMSGKSNLLKAILFLSSMASRGLSQSLLQFGGEECF
ncbi:AAA family ATPase [Methylacidiphilum sp. Yel]|uniref:AAA family ATPase n=1 Tax=Methylacidiphilum sp. Yel TaxID=1847730 RepID=UPI00106A6D2A